MRKITYITGTRADYGLMKKTLQAINNHPELKLTIIATGTHLMPEFGSTINDIKKDGFNPLIIDARHQPEKRESLATFFTEFSTKLVKELQQQKPDFLLIVGDRAEMLAGAVVAIYLGIPVAHLHGGEISGHVDNPVRHAITQLSTVHLPATKESADRIKNMGIDEKNIHVVGAPGLVGITENLVEQNQLFKKIGVPPQKEFLLISYHPVDNSQEQAGEQIRAIIGAAKKTGLELVIGYPNADPGSDKIIATIKQHENDEHVHVYKSLPYKEFNTCMRYAKAMIGNSSSGIIEAASFKLPVVNVGDRQQGRQRSGNTIDVTNDQQSIEAGTTLALNDKFRKKMSSIKNVYGDGKTAERVAELLATIKL